MNPELVETRRSTAAVGAAPGLDAAVGPGFAPVIGTIKGKLLLSSSILFLFSWISKAALPRNCVQLFDRVQSCTSIGGGTGFYTFICVCAWVLCALILYLHVSKGEAALQIEAPQKAKVNYWVLELALVGSIGFTAFCSACNTSLWTSRFAGGSAGFMKFGVACAFFGSFGMAVLTYVAFKKLQANPTVIAVTNGNANPEHAFRGGANPVAEVYVPPAAAAAAGPGPGMVYPGGPGGPGAGVGAGAAGHPGVNETPPPSYEASDSNTKAPPPLPRAARPGSFSAGAPPKPASRPGSFSGPPKPASRPGPAPGVYGI